MKSVTVIPAGRRSFSLSYDEQVLIHSALAETLEERNQPYTQQNLRMLCRLHRRLSGVFGFAQDYVFRDGCVVFVSDPSKVVADAQVGWRDKSKDSKARVVRFDHRASS